MMAGSLKTGKLTTPFSGIPLWIGIFFCLMATLLAPLCSAATQADPKATIDDLINKIRSIRYTEDSSTTLTSADLQKNEKLYDEITELIDIDGISRYALDSYWDRVGPSGRSQFESLFVELLEKVAYPNTAKFFKDLEIEIRDIKVIGSKAMVYTSVYHEEEGRVDIDFRLERSGDGWLIRDVYLDGVSLVRNLRTQCQKIIRENSFAELLRRMKEKAEEETSADVSEITAKN
ncbi:MlaC/ttg2D family ABC transporter substrate-binding protein [Thermodesulforhabdus norvegica]|uniref:Phospholipid transport system substrate-binding protein n=1 Tax=Thermodesulforhabdus norvegica TaxID=39841 RepID=A0A1I4UBA5_9BACT|nr:ABC transporter substrate-binding protein [Thermodesulforhabdus norvegica]SFM86252.1 phospholipid transport system substrate-binding protein [Thermodesulforhabdus norvegica]